jgi:putative oxidoreductase
LFENCILRWIAAFYNWIIRFFSKGQSLFLLLMRITWGHQFFLVGIKKFNDLGAIAAFFDSLFIPFPHFHAFLVALFELVGGICLVLGLASRLFALILTFVMITALGTAHVHIFHGFALIFDPSLLVKQAPFPFLITCLLVLIFGPGRVSLDGYIKRLISRKDGYYKEL